MIELHHTTTTRLVIEAGGTCNRYALASTVEFVNGPWSPRGVPICSMRVTPHQLCRHPPRHDAIVATAHLIHGYLGAGKTSFAVQLERAVGGIRFSADEWYLRLYSGNEPTAHLEPAWCDRLSSLLKRSLAKAARARLDAAPVQG